MLGYQTLDIKAGQLEISRDIFEEQRNPRFGKSNPELMNLAFWKWMILSRANPQREEDRLAEEMGIFLREGVLKSTQGPWKARDYFDIPLSPEDGPIWTFHERMGITRTELSDGRTVFIAGEHEDSYDPDFYIYNDVIVFGPDDQLDIYGYPKDVFPPTDFHTATIIGNRLIIIGCLGYPADRVAGITPVYELDLADYHIEKKSTSGDAPGWLHKHKADLSPAGEIIIRGGEYLTIINDRHRFRENSEDYSLEIESGIWHRLTNRNWRQFSISMESGSYFPVEFVLDSLLPISVAHLVLSTDEWNNLRIIVNGVSINITNKHYELRIIIEGQLSEGLVLGVAEELRNNLEAAVHQACLLELE